MKRLKFENCLYKVFTLNEGEIISEINNHKGSNPLYVTGLKIQIQHKDITILDFCRSEYRSYDGDYTHYLFTNGEHYYTCSIKDKESLFVPNIGVIGKVNTEYIKSENKLIANDSNIKSFKTKLEAYSIFNKTKLDIISSDERIKDNESNCSLFFSMKRLRLPKYGKLKAYYMKNDFEVSLYFKDVLVFVGNSDECYFGADVRWLHKGDWIKDTFDFVEKYSKKLKYDKEIEYKKNKDKIEKTLMDY